MDTQTLNKSNKWLKKTYQFWVAAASTEGGEKDKVSIKWGATVSSMFYFLKKKIRCQYEEKLRFLKVWCT